MPTETQCLELESDLFAWRQGRQRRQRTDAEECIGGSRTEYDRIKEWLIDLRRKAHTGLPDKAEWSHRSAPRADSDTGYQEKLSHAHERTKALQNNPRFIAAVQELSDAEELDPEALEQVSTLYRKLEAGEFGREAMIRHYGQELAESLDHSSGE